MFIFVCAADCKISGSLLVRVFTLITAVVMVLRVWAIYNRSRFILHTFLTLYAIEVVLFLVDRIMFNIEKNEGM